MKGSYQMSELKKRTISFTPTDCSSENVYHYASSWIILATRSSE